MLVTGPENVTLSMPFKYISVLLAGCVREVEEEGRGRRVVGFSVYHRQMYIKLQLKNIV